MFASVGGVTLIHGSTYGKNPPVSDPLAVASAVAGAVGELLRDRWHRPSTRIHHKGPIDLVTDADLAAEELAVRLIRAAFPHHAIVAEETMPAPTTATECWYIDPLDGTTNFAHRYPHYAVSIAFVQGGEPVLGVVHDPLRNETFTAACGTGACLNGRPVRVSNAASLDESLLATGFPYDRRERTAFYIRYFQRFLARSQGIRRGGCAALDLCYVAAGRLDGFWEWNLKPWDTAAGSLIVTEAGGRISDFTDRPFSVFGDQLLATNGVIHEQMLTELAELLAQHGADDPA
jgi:myo-inositol-1(or 4)-monophosphatase